MGKCKIHSFGNCKVEELQAELEKRGFSESSFDMILSRWCFAHLADPVGTFAQAYNFLRPGSGIFLANGFYFFYEEQTQPDWHALASCLMRKENVIRLLVDTRAPVLVQMTNERIDQFIVRRLDEFPCELPMHYSENMELRKECNGSFGSEYVCKFKRVPQNSDASTRINLPDKDSDDLFGSKSLFDWLKSNSLIASTREWEPLTTPIKR